LRYIFEAIERAKHTTRNEDIVISSALTIEHIMPQKWHDAWPISGFGPDIDPTFDPVYGQRERARIQAVDTIGNLTLLTQGLNASVSNAAFSVKMPALQANTALALNRELQAYSTWDEDTIAARGEVLFEIARKIWAAPLREEILGAGTNVNLTLEADYGNLGSVGFPADGTRCRFTYSGTEFAGEIINRQLVVSGQPDPFSSFSAASKAVTGTSRNGWHDWYLLEAAGTWIQADLWRRDIA
jgi:hypothetical protein